MTDLVTTDFVTTDLDTADWRRTEADLPSGIVQRIDPRARIVVGTAFALTAVALHRLPLLAAALLLALVLAGLARLPMVTTVRRMLAMDAFMVPILILLPFTVQGEAIAAIGGWAVSLAGVEQAGRIMLTANAVVLALLALVGTIEPALLGHALRGLGLPEKLTQMLALTTRYVAVLHREYGRLRQAMRARAFRARGTLHTWRSLGYLFGMLLVRSVERAERIGEAMKCRGFCGRFPTTDAPPLRPVDGLFTILVLVLLTLLIVAERMA